MNIWGPVNKAGRRIPVPKPDRSSLSPNLTVKAIDRELDIGWAEGEWKDGRPYRAELWSWGGLLAITFFLSTLGLEDAREPELAGLLEKNSLVEFLRNRKVYPEKVLDSAKIEMWSVTIPIREGNENLVKLGFRLNPYSASLQRAKVPRSEFLRSRIFPLGTPKSKGSRCRVAESEVPS
ncbi:MAG: hypothetical protein NTX30_23520 [Deltaproteobacteria bacterium]|jgi:hypothetical protein|nr:hypothetical protein [Deltaproteobacteria bacterium]